MHKEPHKPTMGRGAITICNVLQRVQEAHELKVDWRAITIAAEKLLPLLKDVITNLP